MFGFPGVDLLGPPSPAGDAYSLPRQVVVRAAGWRLPGHRDASRQLHRTGAARCRL